MQQQQTTSGFVSIVGRPNVGKSTLLNAIIGQKISITSKKAQTTRHQVLGIDTDKTSQMIFIDTPGIDKNHKKALNHYMNKAATSTISDVDVLLFMLEANRFSDEDAYVLKQLKETRAKVFLVINKIDQIKDKSELLAFIQEITEKQNFEEVFLVSAKKHLELEPLKKAIRKSLPEGPFFYPESQVTDRPTRFLAAEIIREKVFRQTGQELPYGSTVIIDLFKPKENGVMHIAATIFVERESHKRMIIGNKGEKLKRIGSDARVDIEKMIENKVFLQLWCKVKSGWADNEQILASLGYEL